MIKKECIWQIAGSFSDSRRSPSHPSFRYLVQSSQICSRIQNDEPKIIINAGQQSTREKNEKLRVPGNFFSLEWKNRQPQPFEYEWNEYYYRKCAVYVFESISVFLVFFIARRHLVLLVRRSAIERLAAIFNSAWIFAGVRLCCCCCCRFGMCSVSIEFSSLSLYLPLSLCPFWM